MTTKNKKKNYFLPIILGVIAFVLAAVCLILFLNDPYKHNLPGISQEDPQQSTPTGEENTVPSVSTEESDNESKNTDPADQTTVPSKPTEPIKGDVDDDIFEDDNETPPADPGNDTEDVRPEDPEDIPAGKPDSDPEPDPPAENPNDGGGLQPDNDGDNFQGGVPF